MNIICISGKAQHGKDTVAAFLKDYLMVCGYKVLIAHYADLLKFICRTYFDWNGEKDDYGRQLLQRVGTDVVRQKAPNYWVESLVSILRLFEDEWDYVIIADCRFPNELYFPDDNVKTIRVVRDNPEWASTRLRRRWTTSSTTLSSTMTALWPTSKAKFIRWSIIWKGETDHESIDVPRRGAALRHGNQREFGDPSRGCGRRTD